MFYPHPKYAHKLHQPAKLTFLQLLILRQSFLSIFTEIYGCKFYVLRLRFTEQNSKESLIT
jgi:hypothetical protein